jgi:RNA polymerase sigma-70 factor (ECF subfamily)
MLRLLTVRGKGRPTAESGTGDLLDSLRPLATDAVRGNRDAARTLLTAVGPAVLSVVRGIMGLGHPDAEDTFQEAMMAVHAALPTFRGECRTLHFACRVAVHATMNARRRAAYRSRTMYGVPPEELSELVRDERSPEAALAVARQRAALRELLCDLSPVQSEALALHIVLGCSIEETAAMTGAPINTVRSRLRNALAVLRARVESDRPLSEVIAGVT